MTYRADSSIRQKGRRCIGTVRRRRGDHGLDQALSHAVGDTEPVGQCVARVAEQVEAQAVIANGLEVVSDRLRRERNQGRAEVLQCGAMLFERLQLNRAVRTSSAAQEGDHQRAAG